MLSPCRAQVAPSPDVFDDAWMMPEMIELGLLDKNSKYPKDKENVDPRW